jgi:hypothetical protein
VAAERLYAPVVTHQGKRRTDSGQRRTDMESSGVIIGDTESMIDGNEGETCRRDREVTLVLIMSPSLLVV